MDQMLKQSLSTLLVIFFLHCITTSGQSPAPAPAPSGPINIVSVLKKTGKYSTFIRLLKSTQIDDQINSQLNDLNQALTVFVPTDSAFSYLKPGMLNSLTDQQKFQLVQFHVVPSFLSIPQFQTVGNPLRTQAGGGTAQFPLNITMSGNQVNMTTGLVNTSLTNTVYSTDGQLAVYEIDRVLLSEGLFRPPAAQAPAPPLPPKTSDPSHAAPSGSEDGVSDNDSSDAKDRLNYAQNLVPFGVAIIVQLQLCL